MVSDIWDMPKFKDAEEEFWLQRLKIFCFADTKHKHLQDKNPPNKINQYTMKAEDDRS